MLSKLIITLEPKEGINVNMSSLMQGVLMEKISPTYAEALHEGGLNPYTQSLRVYKNSVDWIITTLTEEAERQIIQPVLNDSEPNILLEQKEMELKILQKEQKTISYKYLTDEIYFGESSSYLMIAFDSPVSFKVDGKYQFYPTVKHIFQSLINKYDAFSGDTPMFSEVLMDEIEQYVSVVKYNLQSTMFHLEGVKIPAFRGAMTVRIRGPLLFRNLLHLLAEFGGYSGVGIKTAIGMGAMHRVTEQEVR